MACQILPLLLLSLPFTTSFILPSPASHLQPASATSTSTLTPKNSTYLLDQRSTGWSPAVALQDSQGVCPSYAYINCQSITEANYCCGEGTYCAYGGEANHIGCCADADTCSGTPPDVTATVRVPSATGTTWWTQSGTTVTELIGPVYTVTTTATEYVTGNPTICSTMYAHGGNLPATAQAECGLVLVLSHGNELGMMGMAAMGVLNLMALLAGLVGLV